MCLCYQTLIAHMQPMVGVALIIRATPTVSCMYYSIVVVYSPMYAIPIVGNKCVTGRWVG